MNHELSLQASVNAILRPVNMLQIGLGLHPDRTILLHAAEMAKDGINVRIKAGVDLESARDSVLARMEKHGDARPDELLFLSPDSPYAMDARTEAELNRLVEKHAINGVAVSVPPEGHFAIAEWALRKGLSLFLDKPITTRPNAVNSLSAARGIVEDHIELEAAYEDAKRRGPVCAMVNAQRPYMPIHATALKKVAEVLGRTSQPVTNITVCHADGQFRIGSEIIDNAYHGYRNGMGKNSHSSYHIVDMVCRHLAVGIQPEARPEYLLVRSSFVQPDALVTAMPSEHWRKLFGQDYCKMEGCTDSELIELGRRMGEVDAHVCIEAIRDGALVTTANLHLQHNTVSARSTVDTPRNWYKSSGRLKREMWHIDQGHMQSIRIETLQAEDKHDGPGAKGDRIGDPNHLDLVCIRNERLVGTGPRIEILSAAELAGHDTEFLHSERAKMAALAEFVACVQGQVGREDLTSDLTAHRLGVRIMAAAYESHIRRGPDRLGNGCVRVEMA